MQPTPLEPTESSRAESQGAVSFVLLITAVALVLVALMGVPQKGEGKGGGAGGGKGGNSTEGQAGPTRSLFVWDSAVTATPAARRALVDFALERGIGRLFLDASAVGYRQSGAIEEHTALADEVHAAGIELFAAGGYPWWGVSDTAALPSQPTGHGEGWDFYEAIATSGVPYDGVLDDTEPYLAAPDDWQARTAERAQDYLDFLHGVRARTGALPLFATIPFWYDQDPAYDLALDGEQAPRPLNAHVAGIADGVVVMAYRDFARGAGGILEHTAGELALGPTVIAVETTYLGDDPVSDKLSFWQEGEAYMESELALVSRDLRREPNLAGFAIHDEPGYRALRP